VVQQLLFKSTLYGGGKNSRLQINPYAEGSSSCFTKQLPMLEVQTAAL